MYDRFTDRARKVMQLANQEAKRLHRRYIGTEHILLALAKEGSGVAVHVLKTLGVKPRQIIGEVERLAQNNLPVVDRETVPHAKRVIAYSLEEAGNLDHNYIGTEHILLGLLRDDGGPAATVLMNLGLRLDDVRAEIVSLLGCHDKETNAHSPDSATRGDKVYLGSWFITVFAWDGLLPTFIILTPTLIEVLIPNNRGAIEFAAVLLPISAFFIRFCVGSHHIVTNRCGRALRRVQFAFLCLGLLVLALIDCVLMLSHIMPNGAAWATRSDRIVWAILASFYLTSMTIAMYPGRTEA